MDRKVWQIILGFDIATYEAHVGQASQLRLRMSCISVHLGFLHSARGRLTDLPICDASLPSYL